MARKQRSNRDICKKKKAKKTLKTKKANSLSDKESFDDKAQTIRPNRTMPDESDDDNKEEDAANKHKPRKRRRVIRKKLSNPWKKRKLNDGSGSVERYPDTPMPVLYKKRRRKTFSPIKTPKRRVRKNKNVRVKIDKQWHEGVVHDMNDEWVTIRYKTAAENMEKRAKFIMKEKILEIDSMEFELINNRQLRWNRLMFD